MRYRRSTKPEPCTWSWEFCPHPTQEQVAVVTITGELVAHICLTCDAQLTKETA